MTMQSGYLREQADNQRDGRSHRACARLFGSKDLRTRKREQARSKAVTRAHACAHAGWCSRNQRACSRLSALVGRTAWRGPSAPNCAGTRSTAVHRYFPAQLSPVGPRERTPIPTEFVSIVRFPAPGRDVARLGPNGATRGRRSRRSYHPAARWRRAAFVAAWGRTRARGPGRPSQARRSIDED